MTGYVEAFKCTCGHYIPKYAGGGSVIPFKPAFAFYACCPKCGEVRDNIKLVTGKWHYKEIIKRHLLFFKTVQEEYDFFEEKT